LITAAAERNKRHSWLDPYWFSLGRLPFKYRIDRLK